MAQKPITFTQARILAALRKMNGRQYAAAHVLGCHPKTIERAMKKYPAVAELIAELRGHRIDTIEDVLFTKAKAGEGWAVTFFLRMQARDRGYVERQEVTGSEGKDLPPLQIILQKTAAA